MIQSYYMTVRDVAFQLIPDVREGCWMHVEEATSDDRAQVAQKLGLEVSDLQDCLNKYRAEKKSKEPCLFLHGIPLNTKQDCLALHYEG